MKFKEFKGGVNIPVSNEELRLINMIRQSSQGNITLEHLKENDIELARRMVTRGLLNRIKVNDMTHYVINDNDWSD